MIGAIIGLLLLAALAVGLIQDLLWLVVVAGLGLAMFTRGLIAAWWADRKAGYPKQRRDV